MDFFPQAFPQEDFQELSPIGHVRIFRLGLNSAKHSSAILAVPKRVCVPQISTVRRASVNESFFDMKPRGIH
jgi:hypothetical protein